jgi:hypothetical protein
VHFHPKLELFNEFFAFRFDDGADKSDRGIPANADLSFVFRRRVRQNFWERQWRESNYGYNPDRRRFAIRGQ